jgi:signal transduction histidine kinase
MKEQDSAGAVAPAVDRARVVGARRGITGKISAIFAALLVLFLAATGALGLRVNSLETQDPVAVALTTGRQTALASLVTFQEQVRAFDNVLIAGTDPAARATRLSQYRAYETEETGLIAQAAQQLPAGKYRDATLTFAAVHAQLSAKYDRTLQAFVSTGGKDERAAAAAVEGIEVSPFETYEASTTQMRIERDNLNAAQVRRVEQQITIIYIVAAVIGLGITAGAVLVLRRVVRPIRHLTATAEQVASKTLPEAVDRIRTLGEGEAAPTLEPIVVTTTDETAQLADAFHTLQNTALQLAVDQHRAEAESAQMLVNLGRRNQNLLNRTLAYITELESSEQDPDVLDQLFRLDHATTRIRRNAESMLVLAGAHQTRTWSVPAEAVDVVRAAMSEIEDYNRVDIYHVQPAAISGSAIADVVHLLAELVENATTFSPPTTKVTVVGQMVPDGYRIRIIDEGIGMTRSELEASNRTIRLATEGRSASKLLGLYVVGRLAARRGIEVTLEASGGRGVTANVVLPRELLTELAPERPQEPAEQRAPEQVVPRVPEPNQQTNRQQNHQLSHQLSHQQGRDVYRPPASQQPVQAGRQTPVQAAMLQAAIEHAAAEHTPMRPAPVPAAPVGPVGSAGPVGRHESRPESGPAPVVRRVPGAQLPDLGPYEDSSPALGSIDAVDVRGRLSSLQAGVRAGREAGIAVPVEPVHQPEQPAEQAEQPERQVTEGWVVVDPPVTEHLADTEAETVEREVAEVDRAEVDRAEVDEAEVDEAEVAAEVPVDVPATPVRVPGAQLPDLGLIDNAPDTYLAPPSMASRWALRSFQLDVDAARRVELDNPDAAEPLRSGRTPEES